METNGASLTSESRITREMIDDAVRRFLTVKEGARKFHRKEIGDVNVDCCFGDFVATIAGTANPYSRAACIKRLETNYGHDPIKVKAAISESSGTIGGYLVPQQLEYELMETVEELAIFRQFCQVVPMESATLDLPLPDMTTAPTTAGVSPFLGGIQMSFTALTSGTETEPQYRSVELKAWPLNGLCYASETLLQDAPALDGWLKNLFAHSVAWYEDYFFFQGNGVAKPQGVISAPATIQVNRAGGNAFNITDFGAMMADLMPGSWERAIWVVHPTVWAQIVILGGAAAPTFQVNQPMLDADGRRVVGKLRPYAVLGGLPMYVSEKVSKLGTLGDVVLFDPWMYVVAERTGMLFDFSAQYPTAFAKNQGVFRIWKRLDGRPKIVSKITLQDTVSTCSPFVVLN